MREAGIGKKDSREVAENNGETARWKKILRMEPSLRKVRRTAPVNLTSANREKKKTHPTMPLSSDIFVIKCRGRHRTRR